MNRSIKTLVLMLVLVLVSGGANGQVKFGVTGGLNVSKLSFSDVSSNVSSENRAGWFIGPKVECKIPLVGLGLDAALEYSQRTLRGEDVAGSTSEKYKSIEIPINLRYSVGLASLVSLHVATGPQFGFNIGGSKWSASNLDQFKLKNSVVTWNVGAGVTLVKHLEIGVGYNFAVTKLAEHVGAAGSFKTNSWQLSATYLF